MLYGNAQIQIDKIAWLPLKILGNDLIYALVPYTPPVQE